MTLCRFVTRRGVHLDGWYAPHPLRRRTPMVLFAFPCTYLLVWCFDRPNTSPSGWCWISSWLDDDEPSDGGCPTIQRSIPRRDFPPNRSDRTSWKDRFFSRFSVQIHMGVDRFRGKKGPRSVEECERTTRRPPPTHHVRLQLEGAKNQERRTSNTFRVASSWNKIQHVGKKTRKKETRKTRHVHERTE